MSYTPTTWAAGDTVTSAKLNKIEQGIVANEHPVIKLNFNISTSEMHTISSASYNDLVAAIEKGILPFLSIIDDSNEIHLFPMAYNATYDDVISVRFGDPSASGYSIALFATTPTALLHLQEEEEIEPGEQSNDEPVPLPFDKPDIGAAR